MAENKTRPTEVSVAEFLNDIPHPTRRADGLALDALFRKVTGYTPQMWGPTMVGYGSYDYVYETGHSGTSLATGFSPRKANLVLYILPGYARLGDMLTRLGKHKIGKSCLYINKLADVDMDVVAEIIRAGLDDLAARWSVKPS
ncbi:DUF1801 domain-containing protein [Abyssibius alkaniclasticus]|uniref:DUF1801 domain-containing protein n=1 Tax=Abyssibius alkaniclasticus TaxID=2881234 RepID=UPI0023637F9C|nr:DUF1801 domain-containing protein [Abyssibius alkaniclasticus]UPH69915.1 DUF1801 domain-containing protein [Abyssibius alkaniclasticus]